MLTVINSQTARHMFLSGLHYEFDISTHVSIRDFTLVDETEGSWWGGGQSRRGARRRQISATYGIRGRWTPHYPEWPLRPPSMSWPTNKLPSKSPPLESTRKSRTQGRCRCVWEIIIFRVYSYLPNSFNI